MLKILYLTDTHLRVRPSRSRTDNLYKSLRKKLQEVSEIAKDVDYVVHGGDVFHSSTQSVGVMRLFLDFLDSLSCPFYSLVGNHDVVGKNQGSLRNNLLGLVARVQESEQLTLLLSGKHTVDLGEVVLYGQSVEPGLDSRTEIMASPKVKPVILVIHSMLVPKSFPSEHVPIGRFKTNAEMVLCAHYHPGFPITELNGTVFVAPGALCRLEATLYNFERCPQVALITVEQGKLSAEYIELKSALKGEQIFDLEKRQLQTRVLESVATYVSSLEDISMLQLLELDKLPAVLGKEANFSPRIVSLLEEMLKEV